MKKSGMYGCFVLILVLLIMTACGRGKETVLEPSEENDLIAVGFSQVGAESDWRVANTESVRTAFTAAEGYELIYSDAQQKQENQLMAIRRFILQEVDYILLDPVACTGWDSVLEEAKEAGIPVILLDRMIETEDESLYTAYVGSDFYAEGQMAVDWLEQCLEEQGRADDPISILRVCGTEGSTPHVMRSNALNDALNLHENWTLTAEIQGDFTRAKAYQCMRSILNQDKEDLPQLLDKNGELTADVIYCENDDMAQGVLQALEESGIETKTDDLIIIAFDATGYGLSACIEGRIDLDVECNPLLGPMAEEIVQELEAGGTPEKMSYLETSWFDTQSLTQSIVDEREY